MEVGVGVTMRLLTPGDRGLPPGPPGPGDHRGEPGAHRGFVYRGSGPSQGQPDDRILFFLSKK